MQTRRDFLRSMLAAGITASFWPTIGAAEQNNSRILVLIELNGGNDGLNTVIPYTDPRYYYLRPTLAIDRDQVLSLSETLAFHPALEPLMPIWKTNELALALGVGYPKPNRSHFRSIEIWDTGASSNEYLDTGWLGRLLPHISDKGQALDGIVIGNGIGPLQGTNLRTLVTRNPEHLLKRTRNMSLVDNQSNNPALAHLLAVHNELTLGSQHLRQKIESVPESEVSYPKTRVGRVMRFTGELIRSGAPAKVIKISHGSFDNHANQRGQHQRLLKQLAEALATFRQDMRTANKWNDVLVMTYSEFGRRVKENGSRGTDHGTAAPHFLLGGRVKGGVYGKQPSLTDLDSGDLKHHLDYRSLYTTVAKNWWGVSSGFLNESKYKAINCIS